MIQQRMLITFPLVAIVMLGCALLTATPEPAADLGNETMTQEAIGQVEPTLEISPTSNITASNTPTFVPSASPSLTPVQTPAQVKTEVGVGTVTPITQSPTVPSPTNTPSPLPRVSASSTPSPLPSGTAGTEGPIINTFRANVEEADPGDTITLGWATSNSITITLWHLAPTGQFSRFWDVSASGSFDYEINHYERNRTTFALSAADSLGNTEMATVAVTLRCPDEWFFENPPDICPAKAALISDGAEQSFEHGFMIWIAKEDRIYVLFEDGNSPNWNAYTDEWDPGEPESDPTLNPPPGKVQPVRGFGLVWREQPSVRERLGWATIGENPFETAIQRTSYAKYNETFIQAADGNIWHLKAERSGWDKIAG